MQIIQALNAKLQKLATGVLPSDFFMSLMPATDESAARTTLGLGSSSIKDTGTSGNKVPLLDGNNTWAGAQALNAPLTLQEYTITGLPSATPAEQVVAVSGGTNGRHVVVSDGSIWRYTDGSPVGSDSWQSYTPTIIAQSGTITATHSGSFYRVADTVFFNITIAITGTSSASGVLTASLPIQSAGITQAVFGKETAVTGKLLSGQIGPSSTTVNIIAYDNTTVLVLGYTIIISGSYRTTL